MLFKSIAETKAEYREKNAQFEKDCAYCKQIVCSVPEKSITASSPDLTGNNWCDPG